MSAGKCAEPGDEEEEEVDLDFFSLPGTGEQISILVDAGDWFNANHSDFLQVFGSRHAHRFKSAASSDAERAECRLEFTEVHRHFLHEFEALIESFIAQKGASLSEFQGECLRLLDGKQITVYDDKPYRDFLDSIMASLDYKAFHQVMVRHASTLPSSTTGYEGKSTGPPRHK